MEVVDKALVERFQPPRMEEKRIQGHPTVEPCGRIALVEGVRQGREDVGLRVGFGRDQ
jgi:hypothetical protein